MENVKRFYMSLHTDGGDMIERAEGEYVLYTDYVALQAKLEAAETKVKHLQTTGSALVHVAYNAATRPGPLPWFLPDEAADVRRLVPQWDSLNLITAPLTDEERAHGVALTATYEKKTG